MKKKITFEQHMANIDRSLRRIHAMLRGKRALKRRAEFERSSRKLDETIRKLKRVGKISDRRIRASLSGTNAILARLERSAVDRNKTLAKLHRKKKAAA